MYWRSSGPNRSSWKRRCPTIGKLRRIACFFWVSVVGGDGAQRRDAGGGRPGPLHGSGVVLPARMSRTDRRRAPGSASGREPHPGDPEVRGLVQTPTGAPRAEAGRVTSPHGSDPQARSGRLCRQQRRAHDAVRRPGRSPPDAPHADRRGRAARAVPLPAGREGARAGRPGAAGDAAGRAGALLRPAPRLLAGRALRRDRAPDVPRGVRPGVVPQPQPGHGALDRRGACRPRSARSPRTPAGGPCTWSGGAWAGSSRC